MDHAISIIDFAPLSNEEKIDLFQKNQDLLIKYKPESEFVIRNIENVKNKVVQYYFNAIKNYKGKVAIHPEFMLFFHIMQINDFNDVSEFSDKKQKGEFSESGNCLFVEYIVGKASLANLKGLEDYFKDKVVKKISYVKHEQVKSVDFKKYKQEILTAGSLRS
jgi:ADP-glucose pyrophosphorylase